MTIEELESKLNGGAETQSFEIKSSMEWSVKTLAKDILAMSNVQDGGFILIGVENNTFNRQGLTTEQKATYDIDIMRDQMAPYADPYVEFELFVLKDKNQKEYAVIHVLPFKEIPVICKKAIQGEIDSGKLYYRNSSGRPQSGAVSNSNDMRDIIMNASVRMSKNLKEKGLGLIIQNELNVAEMLNNERQGL